MLEYLVPIKGRNVDIISFFKRKKGMNIMGICYDEELIGKFEYAKGSNMGEVYHIILMQDHKEDEKKYVNLDHFEAILIDPLEYLSQIIPSGWQGMVVRKTNKSQKFVDEALDKFGKLL